MKKDYPLHIPLTGSAAARIFTRQTDDISCGPACLATVAQLYDALGLLAGKATLKTYADFRAAAAPREDVGTPERIMRDLCEKHLPCESAGASSYHGGVAIADITQDCEGHYVVFLCRQDELVLYYDPYEHEFVMDRLADVHWQSGFEGTAQWSVNFKAFPGNSFKHWLEMAEKKNAPPLASLDRGL